MHRNKAVYSPMRRLYNTSTMHVPLRTDTQARRFRSSAVLAVVLGTLFTPDILPAAGPSATAPEVEIKKHSTGKEGTLRLGEKEWYIYIDVDDNRTMILRTETNKGRETKNDAEVVERPMSNAEVDRIINDWASGIKSILKP